MLIMCGRRKPIYFIAFVHFRFEESDGAPVLRIDVGLDPATVKGEDGSCREGWERRPRVGRMDGKGAKVSTYYFPPRK